MGGLLTAYGLESGTEKVYLIEVAQTEMSEAQVDWLYKRLTSLGIDCVVVRTPLGRSLRVVPQEDPHASA